MALYLAREEEVLIKSIQDNMNTIVEVVPRQNVRKQNVRRDKTSRDKTSGDKTAGDITSVGQNVRRDKTSEETKPP